MNNQQPTSNLLKRETYKAIKRMEREQLSAYVSNIYIKGFEAGRKAAAPNALLNALRDTLLSVADIGPTRADAIIKRLSDTMKLDAAAEQPKPAPASDAVKRLATELYDCGMDCCKICVHDHECNAPENYWEDAENFVLDRDKCIAGIVSFAEGGGTGTTIGFNYRMGSKAGSVGAATEQSGTLKAGCNDHAVCLPKPIGFNYTNSITAKTNPTVDKVETLRASGGGGAAVCIPPSAIGVDPYNGAVDGSVASTLGVNCGLATGRSAVMQQRKKSVDELNDHTVGSLCAADAKWVSNQTLAQGKLIVEPCEVYDARGNGNGETVPTITGDHNNRITDYTAVVAMHPTYCLQGNGIDRSETAGCNGKGIKEGVCYTLNTIDRPAVSDGAEGYIVRRLTPLECERLQGFPDGWTDIGEWIDEKGKTRQTTDAVRYKALGNSIAIPPWKWVLKRLCAYYERDATMASLFDGIGGFPLIWEQLNGRGSCLWASEIEEFPLAVTKKHFQGVTA